jgi:hypothetical protein
VSSLKPQARLARAWLAANKRNWSDTYADTTHSIQARYTIHVVVCRVTLLPSQMLKKPSPAACLFVEGETSGSIVEGIVHTGSAQQQGDVALMPLGRCASHTGVPHCSTSCVHV